MKKELHACAVLSSLGFAFYAAPSALAATDTAQLGFEQRLNRLHAACRAGDVRIDLVGRLQDRAARQDNGLTTAQWLQTWEQQWKDEQKG